jgi:hypothetical protein
MSQVSCVKSIITKVQLQLLDYVNYSFAIINDTSIFVCVYGSKKTIEQKCQRVLKALKLNDDLPDLVSHNEHYYKVTLVGPLRRKKINIDSIMCTFVVNVTML